MKYRFLIPYVPSLKDCIRSWEKVYENKNFTNYGPFEHKLEKKISKYLGVKHCLVTSSGTTALMMSIKALNISKNILIPSFTFVATASAIKWLNLGIKFVDINSETLCMCPEDLKNKIDNSTEAVIVVNAFGNPCDDIEKISQIIKKNNLKLIFDSAGAFGAEYKGVKLGSFGSCECFSFHATKIMTTVEGGLITTNDSKLYDRLYSFKNFGLISPGNLVDEGINAKMNEFNAVLGLESLNTLDQRLKYRTKLVNRYKYNLKDTSIVFQDCANNKSTNQLLAILLEKRNELMNWLIAHGIESRIYYTPLLNESVVYNMFEGSTPNAKWVHDRILCLPLHMHLSITDVDKICESIIDFLASS